ncbi:hypothetical protein H4582DRAFT_2132667, partial [Lactarius indigo]
MAARGGEEGCQDCRVTLESFYFCADETPTISAPQKSAIGNVDWECCAECLDVEAATSAKASRKKREKVDTLEKDNREQMFTDNPGTHLKAIPAVILTRGGPPALCLPCVSMPGVGVNGWSSGGVTSYEGWTNPFTGPDIGNAHSMDAVRATCTRFPPEKRGLWLAFSTCTLIELKVTGITMSTSLQPSSSAPNFHPIFEKALKEYKKKTGKEISTHPLAEEINGCSSIEAVLTVLQGKANELNQSQTSDERLTKWLTPTVNVLDALSSTLGEGVGTVFPPTKIIFSAMSILLVAAKGTAASRDVLIELFERIESFFVRLQTHTEVPPTTEMTNVMGKVMAEVLSMLAVATKVMNQSRKKIFLKRLVGRNDIEDALLRLDKLEQGELRMVS